MILITFPNAPAATESASGQDANVLYNSIKTQMFE